MSSILPRSKYLRSTSCQGIQRAAETPERMKPMVTPTLLVLAAGMGSRYGGMKQIEAVGPDGEAIMDYSIFDARRAGFGKVVFVIRKEIEQPFRQMIGHTL